MAERFTLSVFFLFFCYSIFSQTQHKSGEYEFAKDVDKPAEYPGGYEALYAYLQRELIYPLSAQRKGIDGKTFVEFIVDASGYIIPGSVRTLKSLFPACDAEAVRVFKSCKTQWKPAMKNGKRVNQKFALPIAFKLTGKLTDPIHPIEQAVRTVVIEKPHRSQDTTAWALYRDAGTQIKTGQVLVGDSVTIYGWAPWAYYIETDTASGYISWNALGMTAELEPVSKMIADQSSKEFDQVFVTPTRQYGRANAFLSVSSNSEKVFAGECVMLTLAFNVHAQNTVPLQFFDLGGQLTQFMSAQLNPDNTYIINTRLEDIIGEDTTINGKNYTCYKIYKASYCPVNPGAMVIPEVRLKMAQVNPSTHERDSILVFSSKPLTVKVDALPPGVAPSKFDGCPLVGRFYLTDSIMAEKVSTGEAVSYKVTIRGEGLIFPINAPEINVAGVVAHLQEISDTESWTSDQLISSKTFVYQLVFEKPGVYDLKGKISVSFFDPIAKKVQCLQSSRTVTVSNATEPETAKPVSTLDSKNYFIAIDVSQSMQIEDYTPHRLGAVKNGLKQFLTNRENCNIGVILFGGDAKYSQLSSPIKCYDEGLIDSIDFNFTKRGTAIGDAIWLAKNLFAKTTLPKKLVIIGDGDNNAGHISPQFAATLAKKYNITIYAIGVGTSGLVPLGRDASGKPNLYDSTYADRDFKTISSITGGQYYWAKDAEELSRILKMIFD